MHPLRSDPALYTNTMDRKIKRLSGGYVDDLIRAGDQDFHRLSVKTNDAFDMSEDQYLPCEFKFTRF